MARTVLNEIGPGWFPRETCRTVRHAFASKHQIKGMSGVAGGRTGRWGTKTETLNSSSNRWICLNCDWYWRWVPRAQAHAVSSIRTRSNTNNPWSDVVSSRWVTLRMVQASQIKVGHVVTGGKHNPSLLVRRLRNCKSTERQEMWYPVPQGTKSSNPVVLKQHSKTPFFDLLLNNGWWQPAHCFSLLPMPVRVGMG